MLEKVYLLLLMLCVLLSIHNKCIRLITLSQSSSATHSPVSVLLYSMVTEVEWPKLDTFQVLIRESSKIFEKTAKRVRASDFSLKDTKISIDFRTRNGFVSDRIGLQLSFQKSALHCPSSFPVLPLSNLLLSKKVNSNKRKAAIQAIPDLEIIIWQQNSIIFPLIDKR